MSISHLDKLPEKHIANLMEKTKLTMKESNSAKRR